MTIAAVFQHHPPFPGAGALRAASLGTAIASRLADGETLVVLTTVVGEPAATAYELRSIGKDPGDNRAKLHERVLSEVRLGAIAIGHLIRLRPSLVIVSTPGFLMAAGVCLYLRLARIPYVLDVRDLYPEVYAEAGLLKRNGLIYSILSWLSDGLYAGACRAVGATKGLSKRISRARWDEAVPTIYNGCPQALRAIRPRKRKRFTVCFHGVMGFYQDIETLTAVAEALEPHGVDVVVVGYGRKEGLLREAHASNLSFLGKMSFERTIQEISTCHVGLCLRTDEPISRDAFPVKLFEYVGLGLPVIVTPPSEGGDFVEQTGVGVVRASGDVAGIVAEVLRLRDDREHFQACAGACELAGDAFGREAQAVQFSDIVMSAIRAS